MDTVDFKALKAEFPKEAIHWRAQSVTKDGTKAMALAYLDARDVMDRLDQACGPANWQDAYFETAKGRLVCTLSIRVSDEWITKSDGAGETDVEGEKGAISAALKRAAVKWGIGRYLYDMPAPWVPCECYEAGGKMRWKRWKADPWTFINPASKNDASRDTFKKLAGEVKRQNNADDLRSLGRDPDFQSTVAKLPGDWQDDIRSAFADRLAELTGKAKAMDDAA